MPDHEPQVKRKARTSSPNPDAAQAFADYVSLGRDRSLRKLAETYVQRGYYENAKTALSVLGRYSSRYQWQTRIEQAVTEEAERKLKQAASLDADTFLTSSVILNKTLTPDSPPDTEEVIRIRESVRKPLPKGGAVSVNVSVEIRQLAEQLAKQAGMDPEELLREAELIAAGEWEKAG